MKKKKRISCLIGILMFMTMQTYAQVGINADSTAADPSAGLDVKFSDKGVLIPRLTCEQRNAIRNPVEGLMVYCTNCSPDGTGVVSLFQGGIWKTIDLHCETPDTAIAGIHIPEPNQIIWNWNNSLITLGYKWNTTNDYASAIDMGTSLTKTEPGLNPNTTYVRYVWSYNECGYSLPTTLTQSTSVWCGTSITINHVAGAVAPVTKTVTYGTVTNIEFEPTKCWITSNLGADHQATAIDDSTEASGGWYWQFNRKQGYRLDDDGITRTPNTTWINWIFENSDWVGSNDPCAIELAYGWRLLTSGELFNISQMWTNWNGPWNSPLKMQAAGYLSHHDGSLGSRGFTGCYWSNNGSDPYNMANSVEFFNYGFLYPYKEKSHGSSVRCVKENGNPVIH